MPSLSTKLALTLLTLAAPLAAPLAEAQRFTNDPTFFIPRATASAGVHYIHANAPPGQPEKFNLFGGYASASYEWKYWLGAAAEFTAGHATDIGPLGQNLTLTTLTAGPAPHAPAAPHRRVRPGPRRPRPRLQLLLPHPPPPTPPPPIPTPSPSAAASTTSSPTASPSASSSSNTSTPLSPNGVNGSENQLQADAGLVLNLAGRYVTPRETASTTPAPIVHKKPTITCSASVRTIQRGDTLIVTALTRQPDNEPLDYAWTSDAAPILSNDSSAVLDTADLAPGRYHITGHASLVSDATLTATCDIPFRVVDAPKPAAPAPPPQPTPVVAAPPADHEFHDHVRDVLFDYDKFNLRPDAQTALAEAAQYLATHPTVRVTVGGSSDERGTADYNVALGLKRANTVRDALIAAGINPSRIQVVSYGKADPVCATPTESCFQQNRRAAFNLAP